MYKTNKHYKDPTADKAIGHVARDERREYRLDHDRERLNKLLYTIFYICDQAGYDVVSRIDLKDRKTGKVWR